MGRYLLIDAKERIAVIVNQLLVEPWTVAEAGFQLFRWPFTMAEGFKKEWLARFSANAMVPHAPWWSRPHLP